MFEYLLTTLSSCLMIEKTYVLHSIEVITTILKNAIPEYKNYTKEEITDFIDKDSFRDDT